jgi:hypothetical protein
MTARPMKLAITTLVSDHEPSLDDVPQRTARSEAGEAEPEATRGVPAAAPGARCSG